MTYEGNLNSLREDAWTLVRRGSNTLDAPSGRINLEAFMEVQVESWHSRGPRQTKRVRGAIPLDEKHRGE